jgi:hypothetical protein
MSFPAYPYNNQTAIVNNITYVYNTANNAWTRSAPFSANLSIAQLNVGSSVGLTSTEAFDLDDISNYTDGVTNTFTPKYNGTKVTVPNAWNLDVSVNGAKQPAFKYNSDITWASYTLSANKGYCLDYDGNVRFADALPLSSQVSIALKPGTNVQTTKTYPFKPLDIMLGS